MSDPAGQIEAPAGYVPEHGIAFDGGGGAARIVGSANPLPIMATLTASTSAALAGTASASSGVGPFTPDLGRPIVLTLSGTWSGTARVLRSVDGGATRLPLTIGGQPWAGFTGNANEAVAEETEAGATYWLDIALASGALTYRLAQ